MASRRIGTVWLGVLAALTACGDGGSSPLGRADASPLQLSVATATLEPGDSLRIAASAGGAVQWKSSDPLVASVSAVGVVRAHREGTAEISATRAGRSAAARVLVEDGAADGEPTFRDDFEEGRLAGAQRGISWGGSMNARVTPERARSGSYSLRAAYPATLPSNPPNSQQSFRLPQLSEFWTEYYVHVPENFEMKDVDGSDNKKWFLVKDADVGGGNNSVTVVLEYDVTPATEPAARLLVKYEVDEGQPEYAYKTVPVNDFITPAHRGRWIQFRLHVRLATTREGAGNKATGDGVIRVWRNGQLIFENRSAPLLSVSTALAGRDRLGYGYVMGAANNGFPLETVFDLDDFKVFTSDPGWQ